MAGIDRKDAGEHRGGQAGELNKCTNLMLEFINRRNNQGIFWNDSISPSSYIIESS